MTFAPSVKMLQGSEASVLWLWTLLLCKPVGDSWVEVQLLTLCLDGLHSCVHDNNILMACANGTRLPLTLETGCSSALPHCMALEGAGAHVEMAFPKSQVALLQETRSQQQVIKKMLASLQLVTASICLPSSLFFLLLPTFVSPFLSIQGLL